jgi:hypothetical protein
MPFESKFSRMIRLLIANKIIEGSQGLISFVAIPNIGGTKKFLNPYANNITVNKIDVQ